MAASLSSESLPIIGGGVRSYHQPLPPDQQIPLTPEQIQARINKLEARDPERLQYEEIQQSCEKGGGMEGFTVAWTEVVSPGGKHQEYSPVFKPKVTFKDSFKAQMKGGFPAAVPQGISEAVHSKGLSTELMEQYARVVQALPPEKQKEALKKVQAIYTAGRFADVGIVALDAVWRIVMIALAESSGKPLHAMPHLRDIVTVGIRGAGAVIEAKTRAKYPAKPPMPEAPQPAKTEPLPAIEHTEKQKNSHTQETLKPEQIFVGQADARGRLETMAEPSVSQPAEIPLNP